MQDMETGTIWVDMNTFYISMTLVNIKSIRTYETCMQRSL